jgi:putative heme-binding domain-containing protein
MIRPVLLTALAAVAMAFGSAAQEPKRTSSAGKKEPPKAKPVAQPEDLYVPPGFKVELLHVSDPAAGEGSWINLCTEPKGRLIIGGQGRQPILRVSLKDGKVERIEDLKLPITEAMGLLYAFDSLYVNGAGPKGFGLYRCRDTKGTGTYDDVQLLKRLEGGGEHGPHGIALGPDKKLYVINGNHTRLPEGLAATSPHRNFREDHLLPRQWDGNGHAAGILAPGGYVVRLDPDGSNCELVLAGFRNAYDLAFNADGELFTFDSDMEWDWGMPWYRPIRVNHCTSAAEFGWRSGTGKWPAYYPDSLPATVDIGIGSPTGVTFGTGAKFPATYQKALYICDWTYGRLIAVHLTPKGSSYAATFENFVAPLGLVKPGAAKKPLNLTDAVVGDDGTLYFTIGGRDTQAALYRVSYVGDESTAPAPRDEAGARERKLRHEIETFHGRTDPKAVAAAWPHLGSDDRFLRYAARIALESQPVAEWKEKALAEKQPAAALAALLALARNGDGKSQPELLAALERFPLDSLTPEQKLEKLRVLGLSFVRQGPPPPPAAKKILADLDPKFPGTDEALNRELTQVLIYLQAPKIAERCLKQMAAAKYQEDVMHYLFHLRTLPIGQWTIDQRKEYLGYWTKDRKKWGHPEEVENWFKIAGRGYGDGASFGNFLKNFLRSAAANLSEAERKELAPVLAAIDKAAVVSYEVKPRPVVKQWKNEELAAKLEKPGGRNFNRGRDAYLAASCAKCHRCGDEGGAVGPDLTAIASRFSKRDILESIVEPSKVVSDQYQNEQFSTFSGKNITGRVVDETADKLMIQPDPLEPARVEIRKSDLETRKPSKVSPMPTNLIDVLTEDEILDLLAFLESGGSKEHPVYKRR